MTISLGVREILYETQPQLKDMSFADDAPLSELGFSSFDFINLALALEGRFNINLLDANITSRSLSTVANVADLLRTRFGLVD
ncbi:phosphopantetheine-binding protein [Rhizobium rhizogenes]|uniref:phosphopantetheine-binding protein n=1 Tax=Rhizobium rhizogenes TaxID=359 RepID=UPI0024BED314|nr:phosphopantetheine-binding protein [Rhizobium rhizogenes]MDJ1638183.1 phosphopantetheine-binding protein [Rhizobium rhizogenes]